MLTMEEIKAAIINELTVPVWPHAGRALNLSKDPSYEAAKSGEIPTIRIGRMIRVPTAPLRKMLGMDSPAVPTPAWASPVRPREGCPTKGRTPLSR